MEDWAYGTVAEVEAFQKSRKKAQVNFNSSTHPTLTEVETFINRLSAQLNLCLAGEGFEIPLSHTVSRMAMADWTVKKAAEYVELTGLGGATLGGRDQDRPNRFGTLAGEACRFVAHMAGGLVALGETRRAETPGEHLVFTGQAATADRADPSDTSLRQPRFTRGQF